MSVRTANDLENTQVARVSGGLLFRTRTGSWEAGVALLFIPCTDIEAQDYIDLKTRPQ